jgi:uncharacterized protein YgbK (DUF1537 family)
MAEPRRVFALADDLTGALEVGAKFAGLGLRSVVRTDGLGHWGTDIICLCVDAELRHLDHAGCEKRTGDLIRDAAQSTDCLLYLKTDSTLRGNIAIEFKSVSSVVPERPIVYVPAYPKLGRTVLDGRLYVNGIPVHETAFALDPLSPVNESYLPALLSHHVTCPVRIVDPRQMPDRFEGGIYICDGQSNDDIDAAAEYAAGHSEIVLAGPAAVIEAMARLMAGRKQVEVEWPAIRTCLVVNGSKHPISAEQCVHARDAGFTVISLGNIQDAPDSIDSWSIVDVNGVSNKNGFERSIEIGSFLRQAIARCASDAVMMIGGDTCYGFLKAIGGPTITPIGELYEGVPCSVVSAHCLTGVIDRDRDLYLISKAGGFGDPALLLHLKAGFENRSSRLISSRS